MLFDPAPTVKRQPFPSTVQRQPSSPTVKQVWLCSSGLRANSASLKKKGAVAWLGSDNTSSNDVADDRCADRGSNESLTHDLNTWAYGGVYFLVTAINFVQRYVRYNRVCVLAD